MAKRGTFKSSGSGVVSFLWSLRCYVLGLGLVSLIVAVRTIVPDVERHPFLSLTFCIILVALIGNGRGPGIVTAIAASIASGVFLSRPDSLISFETFFSTLAFLAEGLFIVWLVDSKYQYTKQLELSEARLKKSERRLKQSQKQLSASNAALTESRLELVEANKRITRLLEELLENIENEAIINRRV